MKEYDVVVVGAGPAGGQCARELSASGKTVLLIDKAKSFLENNYSSGGAPQEIMKDFSLPPSIVGEYWNKLAVYSTHEKVEWNFSYTEAPILDFDKLRAFLAQETINQGGDFRLGCAYTSCQQIENGVIVKFKDLESREEWVAKTKILVDATGSDRKVLNPEYNKKNAMSVTGIEYHLTVDPEAYAKWSNSLSFFLGHHWMPQGYGWIFPMAPNQLKVGVIRYFANKSDLIPHKLSYKPYIEQLIAKLQSNQIEILDKHGKTIYYTLGQNDKRYQGSILAIGDAISSINPLGCEGIRHAMVSGREAAEAIHKKLAGDRYAFKCYDKRMNRYFGKKWFFSELLMKHVFTSPNDEMVDRVVKKFALLNNDEILDVIFHYRFHRPFRTFVYFCFRRLMDWFKN